MEGGNSDTMDLRLDSDLDLQSGVSFSGSVSCKEMSTTGLCVWIVLFNSTDLETLPALSSAKPTSLRDT